MMWLRRAMGLDDAPEPPRVSPIENNPTGWSSIYPPQVMTNPDPAVSPVVDKSTLTPQALWGALLSGKRNQPVTAAELPAAEQRANTMVDYGMAVAGATQPIRAFHGSPHTFDRFDLSKIGTGEGAQAYGHGLYFAGNEGVARSYRNTLSGLVDPTAAMSPAEGTAYSYLQFYNGDAGKAIARLKDSGRPSAEEAIRLIEGGWRSPPPPGSMYEVNLRTSPERLLDWDKPLSAQPQQVREALKAAGIPNAYWTEQFANNPTLAMGKIGDGYGGIGARIKTPELPAQLREAGIDGIQYLDAGSRAAGDGTRNYVMFRDDIIDILRRYGLFGLSTAMGAAGAAAGAKAPEQ